MSKIVQAVNSMISNKERITSVTPGSHAGEIFFLYNDKYRWSVRPDGEEDYFLWHYPGDTPIESLAVYDNEDWEGVPMVVYKTSDIGTKEARASFADLYGLIKDRQYGMDDVLDDIISDSDL